MFRVGDEVLYGIHGVCKIVDITIKKMDNKAVEYYVLEPVDQVGSVFYIPTRNASAVSKLKHILTCDELDTLLHSPVVWEDVWIEDEAKRKQAYRELIFSGDRTALLQMVHTLLKHKKEQEALGRKFHQCDENFLRDVQRLLSAEFSLILGIQQQDVAQYIQNVLLGE